MSSAETDIGGDERRGGNLSIRVRSALLILFGLAAAVIYVTNIWLTERFTAATDQRSQLRLALYSGNLLSDLQRNSIVPQLLARDPELIGALNSKDYQRTSRRLLSIVDEIGAQGILLLDNDGLVVGSTDRERLGEDRRNTPAFVEARRNAATVFTTDEIDSRIFEFAYSRQVVSEQTPIGVVVVELDLRKFQRAWAGISEAVIVTDSNRRVILSSEPAWLGLMEEDALSQRSAQTAIERAIQATQDWAGGEGTAYVGGRAVLRQELRLGFQAWRMTNFTAYGGVRERVNAFLALEVMGFAILLALAFYFLSRRTQTRLVIFERESQKLRDLNQRLQREIAQREEVQKNLEVAEATLAQSSKLAALGEMSAAVSHELNQPLAAMKTYLAGAKLLLQRKRPDEALSSFQRIDDLIGRMGAITRQLKSYARKGANEFSPIDMRRALAAAIDIMEPQLRARDIRITSAQPTDPVMIFGDQLRIEQVIINLLRNALDATTGIDMPEIEVLLSAGETATLTVRDNGEGISNLDDLFEPFFTTKQPGDGIGLGLAISTGIVRDLGGRLTAYNAEAGGAVFEVKLPIWKED